LGKLAVAGLGAAILILWSCETMAQYPGGGAPSGKPPPAASRPSSDDEVACPNGAALMEASTVTKLRPGAGKDPTDVVLTAELAKPKVDCDYDKDEGKVEANIRFPVTVTRGPAASSEPQQLVYFVAIVDLDNTVVAKKNFIREVTMDQPVQTFDESPEAMTFTIPKDKKPVGYEVLVGFQLTQGELAYNREKHRYLP
jgi:hypothetical protein